MPYIRKSKKYIICNNINYYLCVFLSWMNIWQVFSAAHLSAEIEPRPTEKKRMLQKIEIFHISGSSIFFPCLQLLWW
jgi:hypothetical protein